MPSNDASSQRPDRRSDERHECQIKASVRQLGRPAETLEVVSLSEQGCRLQGCDFAVGTELWIKFSALPALRARTVWAERGACGCRFYESIGPVRVVLARMETQ